MMTGNIKFNKYAVFFWLVCESWFYLFCTALIHHHLCILIWTFLFQVKVEFSNGSVFNLSAEFLRIHSPAADGKLRSIGGEKVTASILCDELFWSFLNRFNSFFEWKQCGRSSVSLIYYCHNFKYSFWLMPIILNNVKYWIVSKQIGKLISRFFFYIIICQ